MFPLYEISKKAVSIPVIAKPNAGMPVIDDKGNAVYSMGAAEFAKHMKVLVENGASIHLEGAVEQHRNISRQWQKF